MFSNTCVAICLLKWFKNFKIGEMLFQLTLHCFFKVSPCQPSAVLSLKPEERSSKRDHLCPLAVYVKSTWKVYPAVKLHFWTNLIPKKIGFEKRKHRTFHLTFEQRYSGISYLYHFGRHHWFFKCFSRFSIYEPIRSVFLQNLSCSFG